MNWIFNLFSDHTFGAQRSSGWSSASKDFIYAHPQCEMGMHNPTLLNPLNTHHVKSFHEFPEFEMEPNNWIVLCRFHHFLHAHLKNWARSNLTIREDCEALNSKIMHKK